MKRDPSAVDWAAVVIPLAIAVVGVGALFAWVFGGW